MRYLTGREIHIMGIQRTGQHAVASWMFGHFEHVCFKNAMSQKNESPKHVHGLQPPWWYFEPSKRDDWETCEDIPIRQGMDAIFLGTEFTTPNIGVNPALNKERTDIAKISGAVEFSARSDCVIVMRNPYNQYASVLKWSRNKRLRCYDKFSKTWTTLAKEVLGETNYISSESLPISNEKMMVSYDQWFESENYRRDIAKKLDLDFTDRRLNVVMKIGMSKQHGSSFDNMKFKSNGQKMDVLNRWKAVEDNPSFKNLLKDEELRYYSEKMGFTI